jgi:hypothetical protein
LQINAHILSGYTRFKEGEHVSPTCFSYLHLLACRLLPLSHSIWWYVGRNFINTPFLFEIINEDPVIRYMLSLLKSESKQIPIRNVITKSNIKIVERGKVDIPNTNT